MCCGSHHCPSGSLNWMDRESNSYDSENSSPKEKKREDNQKLNAKLDKLKRDKCKSYIRKAGMERHKRTQKCLKHKLNIVSSADYRLNNM